MSYDPETHSPEGNPHPQFILDYIAAFKAANPGKQVPEIWDRRNGWVNMEGMFKTSYRRSQIIEMTDRLRARPNVEP